jgi:hypothetical protein
MRICVLVGATVSFKFSEDNVIDLAVEKCGEIV